MNQINSALLYRTPKGNYFSVTLTQRGGKRDRLSPLTESSISENLAKELYETLTVKRESYEDAFPGSKVEEA